MMTAFAFALAGCLTVYVYFYPSEEVDKTAKKIIEEIRGEVVEQPADDEAVEDEEKRSDRRGWSLVGLAHAAESETTVSSPAIEAIKERIKKRAANLNPYFDAGAIGEGNEGIVVIRDITVAPMKERAVLNRLLKEENEDREALYKEVADAIGVKEKDLPQVRASFAEEWRRFSRPGWWVQDETGEWSKR